MSIAFLLCIVILLGLAVMGTPIAYAILVASFAYLAATGQSIGISGKILLDEDVRAPGNALDDRCRDAHEFLSNLGEILVETLASFFHGHGRQPNRPVT